MTPCPHEEVFALTLRRIIKAQGFAWFEGEINVNIIGIRGDSTRSNAFDDSICLAWQEGGRWRGRTFSATTDPGIYWLQHPERVEGTAVLAPGQHRGCWEVGLHRGMYPALVQRGPMRVWRDGDQDDEIDLDPATEQVGVYGINLHRASAAGTSIRVDRWSAGCQVVQSSVYLDQILDVCRRSVERYGPRLSYTLLTTAQVRAVLGS